VNNARILGLEGYGLEPGCRADMVLLQARSPEEALRLRAQRLCVVRGGVVVSRMAPAVAQLALPGRPNSVDFVRGFHTTAPPSAGQPPSLE
jgi:cytosine/creatinine deaminase